MKFPKPLVHGKLLKRYKRFLADVELDNGDVIVAHCTNSGTMESCIAVGAHVYLTYHNNPERKTQYTWEIIKINGSWVGVNTLIPNKLAFDAIINNELPGFNDYAIVKREVKFNDSRFDIYCEKPGEKCFIEVKNVTLNSGGVAKFPDAVTTRGQKHLQTLQQAKLSGFRAVMLYIVQRTDVDSFEPAVEIDPIYAKTLKEVYNSGVEVVVMQAKVSPTEIKLVKQLPYSI